MQEKSDRTSIFLDRFNAYAVRNSFKTAEACRNIGISRSLFYNLRDRKRDVTLKMEHRLADAENLARSKEKPALVTTKGPLIDQNQFARAAPRGE